jgi:ATP-dependent exoDNAse (exonuclease V) beta subunit
VSSVATDELLRELYEIADMLAQHGVVSLSSFLDHLDTTLDEKKFREEGDVRLPDDRIAVMTIHQAKGLEFPAVAVAGIGPPAAGSSEYFVVSPEKGVYFSRSTAEAWDRDREMAPEFKHERQQEVLEERCILYVALTRAKDHLWISSPYADGISRGRGTKESLFTDLARVAREKGLARELRQARELQSRTQIHDVPVESDTDAEAALREWVELRDVAERLDLDDRVAPRPLETVTWSDLARFEECPLAFSFDRRMRVHGARDEAPSAIAALDLPAVKLPKGVDPAVFGALVHAVLEQRADSDAALEDAVSQLAARHDFGADAAAVKELVRSRIAAARAAGVAGPAARQSEIPFGSHRKSHGARCHRPAGSVGHGHGRHRLQAWITIGRASFSGRRVRVGCAACDRTPGRGVRAGHCGLPRPRPTVRVGRRPTSRIRAIVAQ